MPLSTEVGLGPDNIVLDRDPAPPQKSAQPLHQFLAHVYCGQAAVCIMIPLGTEVGLSLGDVLYGYPDSCPLKATAPNFR